MSMLWLVWLGPSRRAIGMLYLSIWSSVVMVGDQYQNNEHIRAVHVGYCLTWSGPSTQLYPIYVSNPSSPVTCIVLNIPHIQ